LQASRRAAHGPRITNDNLLTNLQYWAVSPALGTSMPLEERKAAEQAQVGVSPGSLTVCILQ
jgi:hypothetical protein